VSAETLVVGASTESPVTGRKADALRAAWTAAEVAMRTIKAGAKNWAVTDAVGRTAAAWDCKPVEGMYNSRLMLHVWLILCCRHALVPADAKRDRRKEAHHPQPVRATAHRL
jgi:hypothetical protein